MVEVAPRLTLETLNPTEFDGERLTKTTFLVFDNA